MGTPAYNLVIVSGEKKELDEFEKLAFKKKIEAFCIEQLHENEYIIHTGREF